MKRCPKCRHEYSDKTLEFCLEDGSRLISPVLTEASFETVVLPGSAAVTDAPGAGPAPAQTAKLQVFKERAVDRGRRIMELAPMIIALVHNYWQWIYADQQETHSIANFLLSAGFIVWLLLLLAGATAGVLALKLARNKSFAITGLIVLAINFLLFVVPRR
jgi:hypothetical protein